MLGADKSILINNTCAVVGQSDKRVGNMVWMNNDDLSGLQHRYQAPTIGDQSVCADNVVTGADKSTSTQ
jgi:hypothetical protein